MATASVEPRSRARKPPSHIEIIGNEAVVTLTKGLTAVIDAADVPLVSGYYWSALINVYYGHAYAVRFQSGKAILMHRVLLDAPKGLQVDHIDGDGLNNRRANIRLCTPNLNQANRAVERRNRIGAKGVSISRTGRRFKASITPNGKKIHLGSFATKQEAAAAYKGAARVLWGNFTYE